MKWLEPATINVTTQRLQFAHSCLNNYINILLIYFMLLASAPDAFKKVLHTLVVIKPIIEIYSLAITSQRFLPGNYPKCLKS